MAMKSFPNPILVKPLGNYRLYLEYSDHTKGVVDLLHLAHKGVFKKWDENNTFEQVFINQENNSIAWDEILEICPDTQYLKLIGKSYEQWIITSSNYA